MSAKNRDNKNRWRNITVGFRVSPEESEQIDRAVRLSGLTKQDYITRRLLCQDVVVQGNPRVYKALRNELAAVLAELQRIEAGNGIDDELLDTIELIAVILGGLKGEDGNMDEATPHIHIDFVPFTTGSKRGLDTRVSLKQALVAQGFKGGTRGDTEWSQWVLSEKEQLAAVMERYGIEWEQKGTHDKHLSVLDYKKQEREKEISALDSQIAEKTDVVKSLSDRVQNFDDGIERLQAISDSLDTAPEYNLPEPSGLMTAKTYKTKFAEPLIKRLKSLIKTVFPDVLKRGTVITG